jgi:hypothetical protein
MGEGVQLSIGLLRLLTAILSEFMYSRLSDSSVFSLRA